MTIKTLAAKHCVKCDIARQLHPNEGTARYHLGRLAGNAAFDLHTGPPGDDLAGFLGIVPGARTVLPIGIR